MLPHSYFGFLDTHRNAKELEFGKAVEEELEKEGVWITLTPAKPIPARPPTLDCINREWSNHMGQSNSSGNLNAMISIDKNSGLYNWDATLASDKQNGSGIEAGVTIDLNKSVFSLGFEDTSRRCSTNVLNEKHGKESHNETCIGPISSGDTEEGTKSDDCGTELGGLEKVSFKDLLVFCDAAPQVSETSEGLGGLKSVCLFPAAHSHFDSSIKTQNFLASAGVTPKSYSQIGNCMNTQTTFSTNNDSSLKTTSRNHRNDLGTHQYDKLYQGNEMLGVGNEGSKLHNDERSQHGDGLASNRISTPSPSEKRNARKRCNNGIDLNKKPRQRPRMIKHRPKVVVEGKPRKAPKPRTPKSSTPKPRTPKSSTPKPRTPKLSTPMRATTKITHGSELAAKSCRRSLNFSLENQPRDDNGRDIVTSKKDKKRKYVRKTSLKGNPSEDAHRLSVHPDNDHAQKSCEQALSFKLENQVRDEHNVREIITVNTSLDEKVRKNILKASTNSSKDANEQEVNPSSENAGISCRQDLKCNMENQEFGKRDVREIVFQYQHNVNLESHDVNTEHSTGIASGFTHSESCIWTNYMSLAQRGAATYEKNPLATTQTRCEHNSLRVYQRIFKANQCLKNSRKSGPNFPRLYRKKRMRRQKATVFDALGSIMVAEDGQRQVKAHSRTKVTVERRSTLRTTKRTTETRRLTQRRKHKVVANSEVNCNSSIDSYNSCMRNKFMGMLSPMEEQTRVATYDPESFKSVLNLCLSVKSKRKRSKRFTRALNLVVPTANLVIEEQTRSTTEDSESFKCVLALCPIVKAKRKRSKRFSQRHKNRESKASVEVQFAENQGVVTKEENLMGSSYDNEMPCHNEIEGNLLRCGENLLEIEMCRPQQEDVNAIRRCLRQKKNVMLDIEDWPPQREDVVFDVEDCAPQHEDVLLTVEHSVDASVEELIDSIIHRLGCLHLSNEWGQLVVRDQNVRGALVPYETQVDPSKKPKFLPKVDLDPETTRVWKLLMENDGSEVTEETDKDKEKWWDEQREIFHGRVDSFIARMHSIQGNRRFSPWKGSVVDSVVGAFLTQNVSDHLSSSAFMSLAARFPIQSTSNYRDSDDDGEIACSQESFGSNVGVHGQASNTNGKHSFVCETEKEMSNQLAKNGEETLVTRRGCAISDTASITIVQDDFPLQIFSNSSPDGNPTTACQPCITESAATFREILQLQETEFLKDFYNCDGNVELGVMENEKERSSSDKLPDLKSSYEPVYSPSSHNSCSEIPLTHKTLDLDSLDLIGDIRNGAKNDLVDIRRNLGRLEFFGSETQDGTTVDPYVSLGKCQVSHACSLQTEVMTEKNVHFSSNDHQGTNKMISRSENTSRNKKSAVTEKQAIDWDGLRKTYSNGRARETSANTMDSLNWDRVRSSTVEEVSATIKGRGMNNVLAKRIKEFLDRMVKDHGSIDLEWLRDFPPDKAKEYLLSIPGLGLKSVECIRLLTLHHLAFPVDTNVGRVTVRLGWVPLQPLPEEIQLHLLNQYPVMDTIQKHLWTRLCTLEQPKLYELHYQLITFGKVFCTKKNPNCNACPMRGECRHFASAFASARLALPGSKGKSIVTSMVPVAAVQDPAVFVTPPTSFLPDLNFSELGYHTQDCEPIIEIPTSPEPECTETLERDIEDFPNESEDEIPTIKLNNEEFRENVIKFMEKTKALVLEGDMSKALVAISAKAASITMPKLKHVSRLRTVFQVYELPDSHPLLEKFERRESDDPSPYLLAIWTPGETANTSDQSKNQCDSKESEPCNENTCFSCNSIEEQNLQTVCGTILIPCRTATRGGFPLNGTYFQVNEVFADDESSQHPINVPREWIWNLPRRTLFCGTSATSIFRGRTTEEIQHCFWRGFICVRGFNRTTRAPKRLVERFHVSTTSAGKTKQTDDE